MRAFGVLLMIAALALGVYSMAIFDTTVSTGYGSVHNIGLLQQRQNMLIVSGVVALVGALMLIFGGNSSESGPELALMKALEQERHDEIQKLLASGGIDPNGIAPKTAWNWLRLAVNNESVIGCELLLRAGADPKRVEPSFDRSIDDYVKRSAPTTTALKQIKDLFENPPAADIRVADEKPVGLSSELAGQLASLATLHASGALTADEFERAKARLLA